MMISRLIQVFCAATLMMALFISDAQAQSVSSPPLVQIVDADGVTRLQGWKRVPIHYADNRIKPLNPKHDLARIVSISSDLTTFLPAIRESLLKDGVTDIKLSAMKSLKGPKVHSFKDAADLLKSEFITWVAKGRDKSGPVKIAGFSIVTPSSGKDPGVSAEMFIAPIDSFEALGGWVVPTVRYFGLSLNNPSQNMVMYGREKDDLAATHMEYFFTEWMQHMTIGKNMAVIGTLHTLEMQNGTGVFQD